MSTDKILLNIDDKARSYARIYSSLIPDQFQRKRANAAITALFAYVGMLKNTSDIKLQNSMTIYRTPFLCEQFEIADFYANDYHIDVRVTTDDNTVLIPKIHYDEDIVPDFYIVIKVDLSLKTAEFIGAVDNSQTRPEPFDYHYYKIKSNDFISNDEFIQAVQTPKSIEFNEKDHAIFEEKYLCFVDNEIGNQGKVEILRHLFNCPDCRTDFCCFTGFEMVSCNAAKYPEILEDKTLDIIGAQSVDAPKYKYKDETVYFEEDRNVSVKNYPESAEETHNSNENKSEEQNYQSSNSAGAFSMMSEEDYQNDETKMDFVPDVTNETAETSETTETKDENANTEAKSTDTSDDFFDELFASDDENKMDEVSEIKEESIFENVPEGVCVKPDDLQLIPDDDYSVPEDEMSIIEKLPSDVEEIADNVQKVIIDYDEAGKPIYSYITSADGTGPASEIQNIGDTPSSDNIVSTVSSTETDSGELDFDLNDLIDDSKKTENQNKNDDIKPEEENDMPNNSVDETSAGENSSDSIDELDILDQMFVDGALEREAREQQEVSYTPLGTPVDSHLANENEGPDTLPEPVDEKSEQNTNETTILETTANEILDEENKVEKLAQNTDDNSIKNEIDLSAENILEDDNINQSDILEEQDSLSVENENIDSTQKDVIENMEMEENQPQTSSEISVKFLQESDLAQEEENTDNSELSENIQNDNLENEDDELSSVLPSEEKSANAPLLDGYIESELSKNKNNNEDSDYEDDEEYDEDDEEYEEEDDDEEGEDDMSDEDSKKSSLKTILIIIMIIAALLILGGLGAFFFLKDKNMLSIGIFEGEKDVSTREITIPQSDDLFAMSETGEETNDNTGEIKKITLNTNPQTKSAENQIQDTIKASPILPSDLNKKTSSGDINKAITNALSSGKNLITLRGINWKCEAELFSDRAFKKYLQGLDNTLKQNLKNNIMGVTEIPPRNQVVTRFAVDNNRNLRKVIITQSSGSDEVDQIVLRSINETFEGEKSPILSDSPLKAAMYFFEVVIKL